MFRSQRSTTPVVTDRSRPDGPPPDDWLLLTAADRAMAGIGAALDRTSRWQGDTE